MSSQEAPPAAVTRLARNLVWWQAFLAFTGYVTAAGVLGDWVEPKVAGLALVINGGLNQATGIVIAKLLPAAMAPDSLEAPRGAKRPEGLR